MGKSRPIGQAGFTLIELLVVLVVIAIVWASVMPMLQTDQQLAVFNRLCQVLTLECPFWPAVADWIDTDDIPQAGGAESAFYMAQQPMRRAANQALLSVDELRQVAGVTEPIFLALKPYITALPNVTPINVNTASAPVLMAL